MDISLAVDDWILQNIHQQLVAKNAVEVRAFSGITNDYQRCLHQLRDLQVCNQSAPRLQVRDYSLLTAILPPLAI